MTTTAVPTARPPIPACVRTPELFQDPLLEEGPQRGDRVATRQRYSTLVAAAEAGCHGCPLRTECLYRAVVQADVAGFVAGTTAPQRRAIRARLGVTVGLEDLDTAAGVTGPNRQVDHTEVLRLRAAHPDESLDTLARRLGCSLSTVKRHLRRERRSPSGLAAAHLDTPSLQAVLRAAAEVAHPAGRRAA